ncbi:MAG: hypothetical protein ABIJ09_14795 [Pseudomonadota bacterium]
MLNGINVGSTGMNVNRMLDALGLPDFVGDAIGAQLDAAKGDVAGYLRNFTDLTSGLDTSTLDQIFGKGLPQSNYVGNPNSAFAHARQAWGQTYASFGNTNGATADPLGRSVANSLQLAMLQNPQFRGQLEGLLGGGIVMDGRMDMSITVQRYDPQYSQIAFTKTVQSSTQMTGLYGSLARFEGNIAQAMGGLTDTNGNLMDGDTAKLAEGMGMKPPLAFEDVIFLMMMKYASKKEKEITSKMNELGTKDGNIGDDGQPMGTFGGLVGGPEAQAYYNQAAYQILSDPSTSGTQKQQQMAQLQQAFGQPGGGGTADANGTQPFGDTSKTSDTLKQMQMQKMMEDLKKMYEMLSNVMKTMHDMQMAAIRNLR